MIASFWFLIKVLLLTCIVYFMMHLGGTVSFSIADYNVTTTLPILIILCFLMALIFYGLLWCVRFVFIKPIKAIAVPDKNQPKKGLRALAKGLSAVAIGQSQNALKYAQESRDYLTHDYGLADLIDGLAYRHIHKNTQSQRSFEKLLQYKESMALGLKGLVNTTSSDTRRLDHAFQAFNAYPKSEWVQDTYFNALIKAGKYNKAQKLLLFMRDRLTVDQLPSHRAALAYLSQDYKKAVKIDPSFLPSALKLLKIFQNKGKKRSIKSLVQNSWIYAPHPDLADAWAMIAPKKYTKKNALDEWMQHLVAMNDSSVSKTYCAETLVQHEYTAAGKDILENIVKISPTQLVYRLLHKLDPHYGWGDQIFKVQQDPLWCCAKTGVIYNEWQPFNDHGDFNTIDWLAPKGIVNISEQGESHSQLLGSEL